MESTAEKSFPGHDAHGHHDEIVIIVNGREKRVKKGLLTYDEIVTLAGFTPAPDKVISVAYREGHHEGTLAPGESVEGKNRMIFDVKSTNRS